MIMGNVMSRLAMILQRKKVTPNQINVPQRNSSHERCNEREWPKEMNNPEAKQCLESTSNVQTASVEQCGEASSVRNYSDFAEESSQRTKTEAHDLNINYQTVEYDRDPTGGFCALEQNSEMMVSSNECKSVQKEKIFCANDNDKEAVSPTESFIKDSEVLHGILNTEPDISRENILNIGSTSGPSSSKADCFSQDNGGQGEKLDSLSWISKDGYSTEGTAGSESFGDRDDDIIDRLLVDNIDDLGVDYGKFDEVPNGRKSSLTPLSLETFNSIELDRRECVLSYIQAWSPLNLPSAGTYSNSLPGACADILPVEPTSSESYDRFSSIYEDSRTSPNEPRELHEVDSQEFTGLFYQREPEPVSRPLSDNWNLLKNDRAPWINIGSAGSEEVMQGRGELKVDDQDSGWPKANADSWQDPNKGLTICSLSTINEESDDADRIDHL